MNAVPDIETMQKSCDENARIKVKLGEIDICEFSNIPFTNNYDLKIRTELTVVCANIVSVDTHQVVYPTCIYVTSGQKQLSRDSDTLSGCEHQIMTSFEQKGCNTHSCQPTKVVYLHETSMRLAQPYLELHETSVLHEQNEMCFSKSKLLLSTTNDTELNFIKPVPTREPANISKSKRKLSIISDLCDAVYPELPNKNVP